MVSANYESDHWLPWLVKVRIGVVCLLLGIGLAVATLTSAPISTRLFSTVTLLWLSIALFQALLSRLWREYRVQARLQVLTDLVMAAAVIYASGGIDTPFPFLFPLIIISAAILLPRYWAYLTAALAFILYGAIVELACYRIIPSYSNNDSDLKRVEITILVNLLAYLAIGSLVSYLVATLRRTDVQLQEKLKQVRRLEHEVTVRDRMAAIGRLASGIAHEIRNPLSAIAGSAQLLCESGALAEDERTLLSIIRSESERLNGIVSDFLAYSRTKDYHFAALDLLPLIDETLRLLQNKPECGRAGVRIVRQYSVVEAISDVDGDRMRQVLWNICDNAFRAMPAGGTLSVSVQSTPRAEGSEIEISVTDTGSGISGEDLDRIFEPFHSRFADGTGLGLAIVYQIMQAHDGRVTVQSAPGRGTRFSLYLKHSQLGAAGFERQLAGGDFALETDSSRLAAADWRFAANGGRDG